jgi:tetratricopeptide (TPR) repeat protein
VDFTGSASCRECHERFYQLWAPSHHGLAMQPVTAGLAQADLESQEEAILIGEIAYRAVLDENGGHVLELGPGGEKRYPMVHALGGKNVYYFLTPLERGRLQVLPVAFDLNAREWFDTTASGVRHFPGPEDEDEPLSWRDWPYTFNTGCFSCHVSQLELNYDLATDTYSSAWAEPGINCETCHGPAGEHVRVCQAAPPEQPPEDLRIVITKTFTVQQTNDLCAPCHAKMLPLSTSFPPGERYYDHFGLTTLEHEDFYPDGRDLGENYTQTTWLMSPCVAAGELDCVHCHTSSGRYRHADDPDQSCLPCHESRVATAAEHTRHPEGSSGSRCISCHMPATWFARMERHDHSMRPPTPATTLAFESPNACNICHTDKDAAWADALVREWRPRDYQAPVLHFAGLIAAARVGDWSRLPEMLDYLGSPDRNEVVAASLIHLLRRCENEAKFAALLMAMGDPSPLVRAAGAEALGDRPALDVVPALLEATRDEYRLVRVRAAAALAGLPPTGLGPRDRESLRQAMAEFEETMKSRPDDAASSYNLGNFYLGRGEPGQAASSYETAVRLQPAMIQPRVNAAHAYLALGRADAAEASLLQAIELAPDDPAAYFNLGLLLGEQGRRRDAIEALRRALKADSELVPAAYNLGVLLAETDLEEAVHWCARAAAGRPGEARYAYTLAFYQKQAGDLAGAIGTLGDLIKRSPGHADAYALLASIYEEAGRVEDARALYLQAAEAPELDDGTRSQFAARREALAER